MISDLLKFTIQISANKNIDYSFRKHALYFIEFLIEKKPKSFLANCNLNDVIHLCFFILTEEFDIDDEDSNLRNFGSQIIDVLALQIPAKFIWGPIMDRVAQFIQSSKAIDRRAAISVITVISEGCSDKVEENMERIMPWILAGLKDENEVQQSSLVAISEFAKNISDSIEPYNDLLLPLLIELTKSSTNITCVKAYYCLSHYTGCDPSLLFPYLDPLLHCFMDGLNHSDIEVKELALNALSSTISMAGDRFEPYFDKIISIMKSWMQIIEPNSLIIRNRAIECIAMMAGAVKQELFMPHFNVCIFFYY